LGVSFLPRFFQSSLCFSQQLPQPNSFELLVHPLLSDASLNYYSAITPQFYEPLPVNYCPSKMHDFLLGCQIFGVKESLEAIQRDGNSLNLFFKPLS
jgi:hypothetical protein